MDIKQIQGFLAVSALASGSKLDLSTLKSNQRLDVKVVNIQAESNSFDFKSTDLKQLIKVQSNLPLTIKKGQILQLLVSQTEPDVEFKLADNAPQNKTVSLLQQQTPSKDLSQLLFKAIKKAQSKPVTPLVTSISQPRVLEATVLSLSRTEMTLELKNSASENKALGSFIRPHPQNPKQSILTLSTQLLQTSSIELNPTQSKLQAIDILQLQPSQKIQLEISKTGGTATFKILQPPIIKLEPGQHLLTRVAQINNQNLQLQIQSIQPPLPAGAPALSLTTSSSLTAQSNFTARQLPTLHIKAQQILQSEMPSTSTDRQATQLTAKDLKLNQQLQLEVVKTGLQPEFKQVNVKTSYPSIEQTISAKIIAVDKKTIQLQLPKSVSLAHQQHPETTTVITINKNQITATAIAPFSSVENKGHALTLNELKPGQPIELKIIKQGKHSSFEILPPKPFRQQQRLETIKQLLPIQQTAPALLNQIKKNQALIASHEKIPETLKRLAAEILNSLPQLKELKTPQQMEKTIASSGVFLESKFAQNLAPDAKLLSADFKGLLLKFRHAISTQLKAKPEQDFEIDNLELLKELQKKTDNSLAKVILNQLASLPKDENNRQIWLLDLPFFHHEQAESVKIKIDRDQQHGNKSDPKNWSVSLTLTPPNLGTIHCKISCFNETVNTRFWSDSESATQKITEHLDYLKTQMQKAGIKPGHLCANTGKPDTSSEQPLNQLNLLDQKV